MKFCQHHWDALRKAIDDRGLSWAVSGSGKEVANRMMKELEGDNGVENHDPLMSAHNAIVSNAMTILQQIGLNPLVLLATPPADHPEWECPICYLNYLSDEHDKHCKDPNCTKEKELRFDCWVEDAAQDQLKYFQEKGLAKEER